MLDIYLLPSVYYSATNKEKLRNLTLALEQILILLYNPSYNVLKIAGSIGGFKQSDESIQNNKIRNSKPFYIYDELSKELIYVSASQRDMAKILGISDNFYKYKDKQVKYLGQFIFSGTPLNSEEYSENILDVETFQKLVKDIAKKYKKELMKQVDNSRQASSLKLSVRIQMTNIKTNEVISFNQVT